MNIPLLLAFYVIGWLILYFYPRFRALALGHAATGVLHDGDANLACLRVPRGWRAEGVSSEPAIQIVDVLRNSYFTITSTPREDLDPDLDLVGFARLTHDWLASSGRIVGLRGPEPSRAGDFPAVLFEIDYIYDHAVLKYLQVVIHGRRGWHQALGWSTRSRFDRPRFEQVLEGFSELPGPEPAVAPPSFSMDDAPRSRYKVH